MVTQIPSGPPRPRAEGKNQENQPIMSMQVLFFSTSKSFSDIIPILFISLLLSTRRSWESIAVLVLFDAKENV